MGDMSTPELSTFEQLKEIAGDQVPEYIEFENTLKEDGRHAVHAFIWSTRTDFLVGLESFDRAAPLNPRASILMQVRFDGQLGFGGGIVDEPLTGLCVEEGRRKVVEALARELSEEINLDTFKHVLKEDDYLFSTRCINLVRSPRPLFLHFYGHKVTPEQLIDIEKKSLTSLEYGREVMGNLRVPLYTMADGYRGFPAFLKNQFIGTAKWELLFSLLHYGIVAKEEIQAAMSSTCPQPLLMNTVP